MSLNKAILIGRVGQDPETRYTTGGQAVCNVSIATTEKFKNRSGEKQEKTEWHKLTFWGKLAEIVQQYVTKGMLIYVEGKIETRKWHDDKAGVDRYSTGITVREMKMLGGGKKREGGDDGGESAEDQPGAGPEISDEDIPF